jgi:hypothetical protein
MATLSTQRVKVDTDPYGKLILTPDENGIPFDRAILDYLGKLPKSPPATSPSVTSPPSPSPPDTSSPSPSPSPPEISTTVVDGIHVPNDVSSFTTFTNTTNTRALNYPIWVTVKGVPGRWVEEGHGSNGGTSSLLLRGSSSISKPSNYELLGHVVAYKDRRYFKPDQITNPHYNTTLATYKNYYDCNPTSPPCLKICETFSDLNRFLQEVRPKFPYLLNKLGNTRGGKGGNKNVYSRRKLNKTKSKRKTTNRSRSLRSRRNIIRKTKKMYK